MAIRLLWGMGLWILLHCKKRHLHKASRRGCWIKTNHQILWQNEAFSGPPDREGGSETGFSSGTDFLVTPHALQSQWNFPWPNIKEREVKGRNDHQSRYQHSSFVEKITVFLLRFIGCTRIRYSIIFKFNENTYRNLSGAFNRGDLPFFWHSCPLPPKADRSPPGCFNHGRLYPDRCHNDPEFQARFIQ